ncbi:MAG TPA: hypothetical protein VD887_13555 [Allosphingosinicella sp.]|nr:hypothetical protein [Allosphingosinicella sp.]HYG31226.1 hypothetical protein [Allosphingosinicella sp.]
MSGRKIIACALLAAAIGAFPATDGALAQSAPSASDRAEGEARLLESIAARADQIEAQDRSIVQAQGPTDREGFAPTVPVFQLSTSSGETEISLGLSADLARTRRQYDPLSGNDRRTSSTTRVYLQGFAPIDKDEPAAGRFVDLTNPLSGSRITAGFVHYRSRYTLRRNEILQALRIRQQVLSNCVEQSVRAWQSGITSSDEIALGDRYVEAFRERMARPRTLPESALRNIVADARFTTIPEAVRSRCVHGTEAEPGDFLPLVALYGAPGLEDEVIRSLTGDAPTFFFGADATIGETEFSFLDRTSFSIQKDSRTGYSVEGFAGVIGGSGNWSIRGGVSYSRAHEAQRAVQLCRPVAGSADIQCLTGADGAPTRNSRTVASAEGRLLLPLGPQLGNIGIAPEFAIDVDEGDWSLDVPIYFARNGEGQLTGGARIGYASEGDDVSFGFFVGVPFNILN